MEKRKRIGDWEIDTVIGKGHCGVLVSLTERKSRIAMFAKVANKKAGLVTDAILNLLKPLKDKVHTLTADNGKEFALHEKISRELDAQFFFAHPYASWERGLN